MNPPAAPSTVAEMIDCVRSTGQALAIGAGTKPRLAQVGSSYTRISTLRLCGIVEYESDEYTVTARAGTPVRELAAALAAQGQYLPFDPLFVDSGATLGGTVAAGISGPGRFRFGGLRDFILGVRFVDGCGRLLRVGGKVVKNAAGFDLPKFFVGSLGRFGLLAEVTLKVFPRPISTLTLRLRAESMGTALEIMTVAGQSRWQPDALDLPPSGDAVCLRLAGPPAALPVISQEILARWPGACLSAADADALWTDLREVRWAHPNGVFIKVVLTPVEVPLLVTTLSSVGGLVHVSAGGNVAFVSLPSLEGIKPLDLFLRNQGLAAITLRGSAPLWLGVHPQTEIARRIKTALDPQNRFPTLDE